VSSAVRPDVGKRLNRTRGRASRLELAKFASPKMRKRMARTARQSKQPAYSTGYLIPRRWVKRSKNMELLQSLEDRDHEIPVACGNWIWRSCVAA